MSRMTYLTKALIAVLAVLASCKQHEESVPLNQSQLIEITSLQFQTDSMALGTSQMQVFEQVVNCNGTLTPLPDGIADISAPLAGTIHRIYCSEGDFVEKGRVLVEISGSELIDLQKELAETAALLQQLKIEYERMKSLRSENVGSEKEFILAESEYNSTRARYSALKLKVEAIGLSTSEIEKGIFFSSYKLKAPIRGKIASFHATLGHYAEPQTSLFEIVNPEKLQLRLFVFSRDVARISKGQPVRFRPANSEVTFEATLHSIGAVLNTESKTVECYATLNDAASLTLPGNTYVESQIITRLDSARALPEEAIMKSEQDSFVLVLQKVENQNYFFRRVAVKTGRHHKGHIELKSTDSEGEVLVRGGYNIVF